MRRRTGISGLALACAGAAMAIAASCSSTEDAPGGGDASLDHASGGDASDFAQAAEDAASADSAPQLEAAADAGCSPRTGYVRGPYVPVARTSIVCFDSPVANALVADCFDDASTYATCAGFPEAGESNPVCLACLESPENSDAGYGAVVQGVVPAVNLAGCIQGADDSDAGYACAEAVQAAWACAEYACKSSCPVSDEPSREAYLSCTQLAATGVCSTYGQAAQACITAELESVPALSGSCLGFSPSNQAVNVTTWICGQWQG